MSDYMTMEEIKARYAPDWVLIAEPKTDEKQWLLGGRVVFHSPDRDAVYRRAIDLDIPRAAFRYMGDIPEDAVFIL